MKESAWTMMRSLDDHFRDAQGELIERQSVSGYNPCPVRGPGIGHNIG